ncbi:hypothetical protein FGO68_gene6042 [Halteria grandinella]|uniref:Uncharacterized protein n=1 Tax=Halteria grandinella TaxID=5974 RepID=A0A8J8P2R2_HALGN|nr:hypothetical protein FGO68_gene6042 [Halteria grandinella]
MNRSSENSLLSLEPQLIGIPDLVNLVADFCDDHSLSKLSRTTKGVRKMIIEESKDRYIRVLEYKYMRVCLQMESLLERISRGEMIDVEMFGKTTQNDDQMSLYRRFLLNKYPSDITFKRFQTMSQNLENLKRMRGPVSVNPTFINSIQRQTDQNQQQQQTVQNNRPDLHTIHQHQDTHDDDDVGNNLAMDDQMYDSLFHRRREMIWQYDDTVRKQRELDKQCMNLMNKLTDQETSLTDMVDGFVSYKLSRYRNKFDLAVRKMKGQVVCDSDIIMADLLEPTYFINSIQDKIMSQHRLQVN